MEKRVPGFCVILTKIPGELFLTSEKKFDIMCLDVR